MLNLLNTILDFVFPPRDEEILLRTITTEKFKETVDRSLPTEFPFISSLFSYKHPLVRELIWQIKYKKNKHALKIAGACLYDELSRMDGSFTLIPIPISNKRLHERGYNQCELIINEIISLDNRGKFKKDFRLLTRSKDIEKQTFKNREERIKNIENIFSVTKKIDTTTHIIIIDDVSTTGSTLKEAREILLQNGFSTIEALTVAH